MARVKRAVHSKKHHRATLERAKGYYGNKSRSYRAANEQVMHSMQYAYRDRRARKGEFRQLWIQRINAACPAQRHQLQPIHRRPAPGRRRGRPQGARRPGRHRTRGLRRSGAGGQRGAGRGAGGCRGRFLNQIGLSYTHARFAGSVSSSASAACARRRRGPGGGGSRTAVGGHGRRITGGIGLCGARGPHQPGRLPWSTGHSHRGSGSSISVPG